ncbi:cation channel sperm-associated targeting subunit tau-like isoform X2 [Acipenser ruthenus]|uniref:cation channel sperm-associated targeting subunit tau-like isoform X2 n=1 Tax=Acipenser ruthenus TaxID=7906 RepID=UPI002741F7C4|nr:cation channel sperm-associated targeting subunit tau-like isoform X2 [Acipenser ruthenus]
MAARGHQCSSTVVPEKPGDVVSPSQSQLLSVPASGHAPEKHKSSIILKLLKKSSKQDAEVEEEGPDVLAEDDVPHQTPIGEPAGCLAVNIRQCKEFTKHSPLKKSTLGFIRISIGNVVKCSMPHLCKESRSTKSEVYIRFDEWKYIVVQVPKRRVDDRNKLVVELIGYESDGGLARLFGKTTLNLLEIIQKMAARELYDLKLKGQVVCKIELEILFSYGTFGYGYSHQLKQKQKELQAMVERSLFIRIPPSEQSMDPHFNVTTGKSEYYPEFLSPELNEPQGTASKSELNIPSSASAEDSSTPKMSKFVLELMESRNSYASSEKKRISPLIL